MSEVRLYLSHEPGADRLSALEFGRVDDGQRRDRWRVVSEHIGFLLDGPGGREVGFTIRSLAAFDDEARDVDAVWNGPRFHVPQAGLTAASVGEIVLAARSLFGDEPSVNRRYFSAAVNAERPEEALTFWRQCLQAGDCMAHCALGYTLYRLGRFHEAYGHLRYYAGIAPGGPWNWCWYGRAAEAIGEIEEARTAYRRALALEAEGGEETDAAELLEALDPAERDLG